MPLPASILLIAAIWQLKLWLDRLTPRASYVGTNRSFSSLSRSSSRHSISSAAQLVQARWAFAIGLELPLVWGTSNLLLNFIPLVGNFAGILPPTVYALIQIKSLSWPREDLPERTRQ